MIAQTKFVDELPEWFKIASPNARVSTSDAAALMGLKLDAFESRVGRGSFPRPDFMKEYHRPNGARYRKAFWLVSTIKRFVAKQGLNMVPVNG